MSTPFSRLRDTFLDGRDPERALFCTFGLDAHFFEAEVLPALFPNRLALDRQAGSAVGYLNAADRALQGRTIAVFYDHLLGEGPQLPYLAQRVSVRPRAFHPKLALLDYGDKIRAVVSSANLTRAAWTELLELFVVEEFAVGQSHPWAPVLRRFVEALAERAPAERRTDIGGLAQRLSTSWEGKAESRLLSSWDGPLLRRVTEGVDELHRVYVVSPFFEGEEGPGVLDQLEKHKPSGRIYLAATDVDGRLQTRGPEHKIDALLATGRWSLHRVHEQWDGDDEEARLRILHGKLLAVVAGRRVSVIVGSANVTRAALLHPAPSGNVELVVAFDTDVTHLDRLLPQSSPILREELEIVPGHGDPTGEDDQPEDGAERWVESAVLWPARNVVEIRLVDDAPRLSVRYDGQSLGQVTAPSTELFLTLRGSLFVEVDDGERVGQVPLTIGDPATFVPRGTPTDIELEAFCELLAGAREIEPVPGDLPPDGSPLGGAGEIGARGAIPWRRLLAAVAGLGSELRREAPYPREVEIVLRNETRLAGLLRRLHEAHAGGRLLDADVAYALHELRRELRAVAQQIEEHEHARRLVIDACHKIEKDLETLMAAAGERLHIQLSILAEEIQR